MELTAIGRVERLGRERVLDSRRFIDWQYGTIMADQSRETRLKQQKKNQCKTCTKIKKQTKSTRNN